MSRYGTPVTPTAGINTVSDWAGPDACGNGTKRNFGAPDGPGSGDGP